jgi:hypothetical protein
MKTSNLIGPALDWAAATAETWGNTKMPESYTCGCGIGVASKINPNAIHIKDCAFNGRYSTEWALGGPIIEREQIELLRIAGSWRASFSSPRLKHDGSVKAYHHHYGPSPLIAAMRCYVASKLGDDIEIPKELLP